tara:strand:- start:557 stop:901 length:345 start_codon:yes stop_codon:yes gene_type:complete
MFIYKISHNETILYVGSTLNLAMRKHAHEQHRKQNRWQHLRLYTYLNVNEIPANEINYDILEEINLTNNAHLRYTEQCYINLLNPPCNHYNSMSLKKFIDYELNEQLIEEFENL